MCDINKLIFLTIKRLLDNKIMNFLIIIQVFISILTINITIGRIQYSNYMIDIVTSSELLKAIYFSPYPRYSEDPLSSNTFLDAKINSLEYVNDIGIIKSIQAILSGANEDNHTLYLYNDKIINSMKLPLYKGKWFSEYVTKNNETPIILSYSLSSKYKIGDNIVMKIACKDFSWKEIIVTVIGFTNKTDNFLSIGNGSDIMGIDYIFRKEKIFSVIPLSSLPTDNNLRMLDQRARILFTDPNMDSNFVFNDIKNELNDIGCIDTIKNMVSNYYENNGKQINLQVVLWILVMLLTIAGIGGNNALTLINQEKEYSIYFMCGVTWSKCILITSLRGLTLLTIPFIFSYVAINNLYTTSFGNNLIINNFNIIFSVLNILLIYALSSLDSLIRLYKTSPINIIRRWL